MSSECLYNLDYLEELSGGDKEFQMEMIRHFVLNAPDVLIRLAEHSESGDWKAFRDEIHKFTPNLNLMGIGEIIPVANLMEELSEKRIETERIPGLLNQFRAEVSKARDQLAKDFTIQP